MRPAIPSTKRSVLTHSPVAEQSIWTLTELLNLAAQAAEAGVELHVELYVTRGMSNPKRKSIIESSAKDLPSTPRMEELNDENTAEDLDQLMNVSPMADALTIIGGRPHISGLVPAFVAGAEGKSLVVGESLSMERFSISHVLNLDVRYRLRTWSHDDERPQGGQQARAGLPCAARDCSVRVLGTWPVVGFVDMDCFKSFVPSRVLSSAAHFSSL